MPEPPHAGFLTRPLNSAGTALTYSTLLGGTVRDLAFGLAADRNGNAYVAGGARSFDFPITAGAFQTAPGSVGAGFVAKVAPQIVPCTTSLSGSQGRLVIQPGGTTCLQNATVNGAIRVVPGAGLFVDHSIINGAILAEAPSFFGLCASTVKGATSVKHASGFVLVDDPADDACGGNTITGEVDLQDDHGSVEVAANHISGSLRITGTSGTGLFAEDTRAEIQANVIGGALECSDNSPAPTNDGQPNTVAGAKAGQCLNL
jgi:hypothetical protein